MCIHFLFTFEAPVILFIILLNYCNDDKLHINIRIEFAQHARLSYYLSNKIINIVYASPAPSSTIEISEIRTLLEEIC